MLSVTWTAPPKPSFTGIPNQTFFLLLVTELLPFWRWRGTRLRAVPEKEQGALLEEEGQDVQGNHQGWEAEAK